jgi:hypothetical protein
LVPEPPVRFVGADASPGSGLAPLAGSDPGKLCQARPDFEVGEPRPAGVCVAIDSGPFHPSLGSYVIPEGEHVVRAFAVDTSGQRGRIEALEIRVDLSDAEPSLRALPEDPARNGWYRRDPLVVLRAVDGDQNAGVREVEYRLGTSGAWSTYDGPFSTPVGSTTVQYRTVDEAGRVGEVRSQVVSVDPDATEVRATSAQPTIWSRLLGPSTTKLRWVVTEATSSKVTVRVTVYNAAGVPVRHLDGGTRAVTPGTPLSGFVSWNGRDDTLTGLVPLGVYYYRVSVVDDAGNTSMSEESDPITIRLL